jgi:NADPH:quinone reductase-like Zn-dependent oxidoreductase
MRAVLQRTYGSPDLLQLGEIEKPTPEEGEVLVRVRAASVNPADWHTITGVPLIARLGSGLRRPKTAACGIDYAGTVEAVGAGVTRFAPGNEVFGGRTGAFADYLVARVDRAIAPKPENITFSQAAAVPVAALTALQGLRDKGRLEAGQKVLVNGASGGVGTFAVQIAKALGAEVTGVCSTRNVDVVSLLGADRVVDYTQEDFTRGGDRYDLMLDVAGNRSWADCKRVLADRAHVVIVGGPKTNRVIGPFAGIVGKKLVTLVGVRSVAFFIAKLNGDDLETMRELLASGKVTPVVDREYPFAEIREALGYLGDGHARGKIVITT